MSIMTKDPDSTVDYVFDWSDWLAAGETILSTDWVVKPTELGGLEAYSPFSETAKRGTLVAGGLAGHVYTLTCRITTSMGKTADRSIDLRIQQR